MITADDILEPLKQALLVSRDVMISSQICSLNAQISSQICSSHAQSVLKFGGRFGLPDLHLFGRPLLQLLVLLYLWCHDLNENGHLHLEERIASRIHNATISKTIADLIPRLQNITCVNIPKYVFDV